MDIASGLEVHLISARPSIKMTVKKIEPVENKPSIGEL